jgi:hypothetical protein
MEREKSSLLKEFIVYFQGWPKLLWFVTESKHLSKPPRDWFPHIKDANNDTAYIEVSQTLPLRGIWVCVWGVRKSRIEILRSLQITRKAVGDQHFVSGNHFSAPFCLISVQDM